MEIVRVREIHITRFSHFMQFGRRANVKFLFMSRLSSVFPTVFPMGKVRWGSEGVGGGGGVGWRWGVHKLTSLFLFISANHFARNRDPQP